MASGVVSIDLYADHQPVLSAMVFSFATAVWLLLAVVLAAPLVYQRGRFAQEAGSPATIASVAATVVLGVRFAAQGYHVAAAELLAVAADPSGRSVVGVHQAAAHETPSQI